MREECHLAVAEPKRIGDPPGTVVGSHTDDLTLPEMIAAAVRAKLGELVVEVSQGALPLVPGKPIGKGGDGVVMAAVAGILTVIGPVSWNSDRVADLSRRTLDEHLPADGSPHRPRLFCMPLAAARARGRSLTDRVDQCPSHDPVGYRLGRQVELQQAHGALDIDPDRPWIHVRG